MLGIPERSALPRCVRSIQWIRSDRWVVAGSWGPLSSVVSRSGGGDKHADESPSRRRGPRALVSISVSPIGATRAPRRGTRPRVALTLSSLADCKRERLAWRSLRRSSGRGDAARDDYRFEARPKASRGGPALPSWTKSDSGITGRARSQERSQASSAGREGLHAHLRHRRSVDPTATTSSPSSGRTSPRSDGTNGGFTSPTTAPQTLTRAKAASSGRPTPSRATR